MPLITSLFPDALFFLFLWQEKPIASGWLDQFSSIVTPIAAVGLLVAIAYFFWHGKNREELTKALAEATALADTRGKKITDLKEEIVELTKESADKSVSVAELKMQVEKLEIENEKKTKMEFRLRADITDLERKAGTDSPNT